MDNKQYVDLVNSENYPEDTKVPLDPPFVDARGVIQNLWLGQCGSVSLITSKKGAVRASHYHVHDWHSIYVVSGSIQYFERNQDGTNPTEKTVVAGEMVFSKPDVVHKIVALEDTVFLTLNGIVKNHENYENSVVRVEF